MGEIRQLISGLQRAAGLVLDHLFGWSLWRRIHQAVAKHCHWQRHQREACAHGHLGGAAVLGDVKEGERPLAGAGMRGAHSQVAQILWRLTPARIVNS